MKRFPLSFFPALRIPKPHIVAAGKLSAALALALGCATAMSQTPKAPLPEAAPAPLHAFAPALRDTSTDPCTDFYQYACGGWLKTHPIPADRSSYGRDTEVEDRNEQVLRAILEKAAADSATRAPDEQKIGDAYAACMDTAAIDRDGLAALKARLAPIDQLQNLAQLPALLAALHNEDIPAFFSFGAQQDYRNANQEIAAVRQPRLGLPEKGYYDRSDAKSAALRQEYEDHIRRVFMLLGEPAPQAVKDAATVLRMETALAANSLSQEQMREPSNLYHRTPLVQFEANSPELHFADYLARVHSPAIEELNVAEPVYFLSLQDLLTGASIADVRAYLRWTAIRSVAATALPQALDDERFAFYGKVMSGVAEQQPRWKRCAETVDTELGEALGKVYVQQQFTPADKMRTVALTQNIETAAADDLNKLDWMSTATRAEAKHKLSLVANNVGYPEKWRDYSTLAISPTDAFANMEHAAAFEVARNTRKIGKPVDRSEWEMTTPTVNAYYNPQMNSINFPAGILQPPYFDPAQDDAVNFGSAGGVIGHELSHGFDDEGRQFDGYGNLRDWWKKEDAQHFAERAACVEKEYDGFVAVDDLHVNGKLTLGENLADLAGLRLAWLAFTAQAKTSGTVLSKPGDASYGSLTPAQQFFAAYGQSWCENTRTEAMRERVRIDPHSPEQDRVNGVVENMPSFAEAWKCKAGAWMATGHRGSLCLTENQGLSRQQRELSRTSSAAAQRWVTLHAPRPAPCGAQDFSSARSRCGP